MRHEQKIIHMTCDRCGAKGVQGDGGLFGEWGTVSCELRGIDPPRGDGNRNYGEDWRGDLCGQCVRQVYALLVTRPKPKE